MSPNVKLMECYAKISGGRITLYISFKRELTILKIWSEKNGVWSRPRKCFIFIEL